MQNFLKRIKNLKMNEQIKSVIRHALTAIGAVLTLLGVAKLTDVLNYLNSNFDAIWGAVSTLVGLVIALIGFFKEPQRFALRSNKGE